VQLSWLSGENQEIICKSYDFGILNIPKDSSSGLTYCVLEEQREQNGGG